MSGLKNITSYSGTNKDPDIVEDHFSNFKKQAIQNPKDTFRTKPSHEEFKYQTDNSKTEKKAEENTGYYGLSEGMITFGKNPLSEMIYENERKSESIVRDTIDENSLKNNSSFKRDKNKKPSNLKNEVRPSSGVSINTPYFSKEDKPKERFTPFEEESKSAPRKNISEDEYRQIIKKGIIVRIFLISLEE